MCLSGLNELRLENKRRCPVSALHPRTLLASLDTVRNIALYPVSVVLSFRSFYRIRGSTTNVVFKASSLLGTF